MATPSKTGYGLPAGPIARKVIPIVPQILAEGWTAAKLSKTVGCGLKTAKQYLATIQHHLAEQSEPQTATIAMDAVAVARRVQAGKVARAERIEAEIEETLTRLGDGFLKVAYDKDAGFVEKRFDYDAQGRAKLLGDLLRADAVQTELLKELSGQGLAEKALLARLKGEAMGHGIGQALIEATAMDLQGQVWEAVTVSCDDASEGESLPE